MKWFQNFCIWLVMDSGVRLGPLAPHIFHMGLGGKVTMKRADRKEKRSNG